MAPLRPYAEGDYISLAIAANTPKIARWMRNTFPQPYTADNAKAWISFADSVFPPRDFAICRPDGSAFIGGIGLKARTDIHHRTMEIGYWLSEYYRHQGIATEAVTAFSGWVFANFEKLVRLDAEVFYGNRASHRVLEKAGFEFEGRRRKAVEKLGVVIDALTYRKVKE
ncbi:acyl-CoA N-acyltransferase [Parathielavia hyrcaniae]|uniref:Acyl-CoA N-acyltransferase n=1 Tax=Parathielavia hyrcaniae TaxID=113614 RepID=A0AAN6QCR9_9PEZI|nr:acyl-CoA N-acyltransferase [Parathielavia hyrcaniae]